MPDITLCVNNKCPLRNKCYRYRAYPDEWQSFCRFEPEKNNTECRYFWLTAHDIRVRDTETVDELYKEEK